MCHKRSLKVQLLTTLALPLRFETVNSSIIQSSTFWGKQNEIPSNPATKLNERKEKSQWRIRWSIVSSFFKHNLQPEGERNQPLTLFAAYHPCWDSWTPGTREKFELLLGHLFFLLNLGKPVFTLECTEIYGKYTVDEVDVLTHLSRGVDGVAILIKFGCWGCNICCPIVDFIYIIFFSCRMVNKFIYLLFG